MLFKTRIPRIRLSASSSGFYFLNINHDSGEESAFSLFNSSNNLSVFAISLCNSSKFLVPFNCSGSADFLLVDFSIKPSNSNNLASSFAFKSFVFDFLINSSNFDDEAVIHGEDVNIVYIKGLMDAEDGGRANFLDKII
jgi:hypothetical protein